MLVTHERRRRRARARRVIVVRDGLIQEDRQATATNGRTGANGEARVMRLGDVVHVALRALLRNKLRSFLTALGHHHRRRAP